MHIVQRGVCLSVHFIEAQGRYYLLRVIRVLLTACVGWPVFASPFSIN